MANTKIDPEFQSLIASWESQVGNISLSAADEDDDSMLHIYDEEDYAYELTWDEDEFGIFNRRYVNF